MEWGRDGVRIAGLVLGLSSTGCYVAAGPKVGYSRKHGTTLGWELMPGLGPVGVVVGQTYATRGGRATTHLGVIGGYPVREFVPVPPNGGLLLGALELGGAFGRDKGIAVAARAWQIFEIENGSCSEAGLAAFAMLRVGFMGNDTVYELVGQVAPYSSVCLGGGRRLRDEDRTLLPVVARFDGGDREDPLAHAWIQDARAEHASITAFVRMAAELRALRAPVDLVQSALAAAEDETRHTALCAQQAGTRFALLPLDSAHAQARWAAASAGALGTTAREAWLDGCLGEAVAAAHAAAAVRDCRDDAAAGAQAEIAADEATHAELAWRTLDWLWRDGPAVVRDAIVEVVESESGASSPHDGDATADHDLLALRGRLHPDVAHIVTEREVSRAQERARRLIHGC